MSVISLALLVAMTGAFSSARHPLPQAPLAAFVENRGQWPVPAQYFLRTRGLDVWIDNGALVLHQHRAVTTDSIRLGPGGTYVPTKSRRTGSVITMSFPGSNSTGVQPTDLLPGVVRSYVGARSTWVDEIRRYAGLRYHNFFPGIDLELSTAGGPRYSFVVAPGADPSHIRWRFDGADQVDLLDRLLSIPTSVGRIEHRGLMAWQVVNGTPREVSCRFTRKNGDFGFVTGEYDRSLPLVIDPVLFSVMIGGSDYERPGATVMDRNGAVMIVGTTQSVDLPISEGAYDATFDAPTEAFAMKVVAGGSEQLIWATYLGGEDGEGGNAAALTSDNGLVAAGLTASITFPTTDSVVSGWFGGGIDAFVTRFGPDGRLRFSTYLGDGSIDAASSLVIDRDTIVVAGSTTSFDFPAQQSGRDTAARAGGAFVLKLTPDGRQIVSGITVGGNGDDYCYSLAQGIDGSYLIGGITSSTDLPVSSKAMQKTLARDDTSRFDFMIGRINADLDSIMALTYLGGTGDENGTRVAISPDGSIVVGGYSPSRDFPVTSKKVGGQARGDFDMVLVVLAPELSGMRYGCYLGGTEQDRLFTITAMSRDRLLLIGDTRSSSMPTTVGAYDRTHNGSSDVYIAILNPLSDSLIYATYLGGAASDIGYAIHQTGADHFLLCGATGSDDFPFTVAPHDSLNYTDLFLLHLQIPDTATISSAPRSSDVNPIQPTLSVTRTGARLHIVVNFPTMTTTAIDLYDISGRRLQTIAPARTFAAGQYEFDVDEQSGQRIVGWRFGGVVR